MTSGFFTYLFRKSDLARFILIPVFFLALWGIISVILAVTEKKPVLTSINPPIGIPGDVIALQGMHFGDEPGDSWVEIAGNRVSSSAYLKWTDTTILIILPGTVEDGLIYVHTSSSKSNALAFANRNNIPIAARTDSEEGLPLITSVSGSQSGQGTYKTGELITLQGKNFGITRNQSSVIFSWNIESPVPAANRTNQHTASIACSEHDFDYEFWSDSELRVRIPDGAVSGTVSVQSERGPGNSVPIIISNPAGTKRYTDRRTYVVSQRVTFSDISATEGNILFVRIPRPEDTPSQRNVRISASDPQPFMPNYKGSILHQLENLKTGQAVSLSHQFIFYGHTTTTKINASAVKQYRNTNSPFFQKYTAADQLVPSTEPAIAAKAAEIVGKEKNPYLKAKKMYTWLVANIAYEKNANPDRAAAVALAEKKGDAYDMTILFCALARASGIPALPNAGILIDTSRNSRIHWWAEFWLEDFGWVPADPAVGAGFPGPGRETPAEKNDWYFGNLDANHIVYSRGWNDQKPMTQKSRVVYRPRFFAFQPVWEESGGNIKSYTSFWEEPKVTGVY